MQFHLLDLLLVATPATQNQMVDALERVKSKSHLGSSLS